MKPFLQKFRNTAPAQNVAQTDYFMSERYAVFLRRLLAEADVEKVLVLATDYAIEMSGAERGMIILFDDHGEIIIEVARNIEKREIINPAFEISRTIIDQVRSRQVTICIDNALVDPSLQEMASVYRLKLLSVICLPLRFGEKTFGVIYLDNRTLCGAFRQEERVFIEQLVDILSLAAFRILERKHLQHQVERLESELRGRYRFEAIIGHHPKIIEILKLVSQISNSDATVLLQGESGTGKELIARALHFNHHRRCGQPFIPVNCGAIPETLLESELFGHVRGAFTHAVQDTEGRFERAHLGTIFLDEVDQMSANLQVKLLRTLQNGEYSRVGSSEVRFCDVRVVAATNVNLQDLVGSGQFRSDLYYRLNIIEIVLPPLRDRKTDIPELAQHFIRLYGEKNHKPNLRLSHEAETVLMDYSFPGNVRELENLIQRSVVLADHQLIQPRHFPGYVIEPSQAENVQLISAPFRDAKKKIVQQFERQYVIECLRGSKGNISKAAAQAGLHLKNFYTIMKKHGVDPHHYKTTLK